MLSPLDPQGEQVFAHAPAHPVGDVVLHLFNGEDGLPSRHGADEGDTDGFFHIEADGAVGPVSH